MCQSAPEPPPPVDYEGAARATAAGSQQANIANNVSMHPNIYTPLGTQTWSQNGSYSVPGIGGEAGYEVPMWNQNITLSPDEQKLFDTQMGLSQGLGTTETSALNRTQRSLGKPMKLQDIQDIYDKSYGAQTSRLDPYWQQSDDAERQRLVNQGLAPGGEAYNEAWRNQSMSKNDAYQQAQLAAISTMPQTYQMALAQRMQPLTELNALRTGAQPQMPQFQASQFAGGAQGPQLLNAAGMQGNADQLRYQNELNSQNAFWSGLMDLGGAGAQAYAMSDRRLKSAIKRIGTLAKDIGVYAYRIFGRDEIGVMADEVLAVKPEAVSMDANGYLMVNYAGL